MNVQAVMILARNNLGNGGLLNTSARVCMADAVKLYDEGNYVDAKRRAIQSLAYSVGIAHPDYAKASA